MQNLKKTLKTSLKAATKVAVIGIGSDLRSDDAAGDLVARKLKILCQKKCRNPRLKIFLGATAPENLTGEIRKFKPSHIVLVDTAQMKKRSGTVQLLSLKQIEGITFSTHRLPTKIMVDYLAQSLECRVIIIGIQPKSIEFGKVISAQVKKSITQLAGILKDAIQ